MFPVYPALPTESACPIPLKAKLTASSLSLSPKLCRIAVNLPSSPRYCPLRISFSFRTTESSASRCAIASLSSPRPLSSDGRSGAGASSAEAVGRSEGSSAGGGFGDDGPASGASTVGAGSGSCTSGTGGASRTAASGSTAGVGGVPGAEGVVSPSFFFCSAAFAALFFFDLPIAGLIVAAVECVRSKIRQKEDIEDRVWPGWRAAITVSGTNLRQPIRYPCVKLNATIS